MISLEYPQHDFRIRRDARHPSIFDPLRRRWVALTPEEWVRQNIVQYLTQIKKIPASLLAVEREVKIGTRRQRFDLLVFDAHGAPLMLVECKASEVAIDRSTLDQVLRYNLSVPVRFLVITNGAVCYAFERTKAGLRELDTLPSWDRMATPDLT